MPYIVEFLGPYAQFVDYIAAVLCRQLLWNIVHYSTQGDSEKAGFIYYFC